MLQNKFLINSFLKLSFFTILVIFSFSFLANSAKAACVQQSSGSGNSWTYWFTVNNTKVTYEANSFPWTSGPTTVGPCTHPSGTDSYRTHWYYYGGATRQAAYYSSCTNGYSIQQVTPTINYGDNISGFKVVGSLATWNFYSSISRNWSSGSKTLSSCTPPPPPPPPPTCAASTSCVPQYCQYGGDLKICTVKNTNCSTSSYTTGSCLPPPPTCTPSTSCVPQYCQYGGDLSQCTVKNTDCSTSSYSAGSCLPPPPPLLLNVNKLGTGDGIIISDVGGINCGGGGSCSTSFTNGANINVTLTASPAINSNLASWSGCDSTNGTSCIVNMNNSDRSVTANFTKTYELSINTSGGTGVGTVNISPAGNNGLSTCSGACSDFYNEGTTITVTLPPPPKFTPFKPLSISPSTSSSVFDHFSGCDNGVTTNPCAVTMGGDKSVTAFFNVACKTDIWSCTNWNACSSNGTQTCANWVMTCNSPTVVIPQPTTSQSCTPPAPVFTPTSSLFLKKFKELLPF